MTFEEYATATVDYGGWTLLGTMALIILITGIMFGCTCGAFWQRRECLRLQALTAELQEEAERWKQKWWDTDTEMAKALQQVIDLQLQYRKEKDKMNEEMEDYVVERQAANEIQQECITAKALINRARREITEHLAECPVGHYRGIFVTAYGHVWHARHDCHGLGNARSVSQMQPCTWCAQVPTPFEQVNGVTGTTLVEDLIDFESLHGRMRYEGLVTG